MENIDYTQMSDADVQKDLGILRTDKITVCDVVADYAFIGDGNTPVSKIDSDLIDFIKATIGDASADVKIKGSNDGDTPIYSANITSASITSDEICSALKNAENQDYELRAISVSKDSKYEESIEK